MKCWIAFAVVFGMSFAADAQAAEELIFLRGGDVFHGEVLDSTWETVTISRTTDSGKTTFTVPVDDVEAYFYYKIRDRALGDDAMERLKLVGYAVRHDMFSRAKVQMDRARSIDPKGVEKFLEEHYAEISEGLAQKLVKAAQRSLHGKSYETAKKYASIILTKLEGTSVEAQAEKILEEAQAKLEEGKQAKRAQRRKIDETVEEAKRDAVKQDREANLEPIEKLLDDAEATNIRGLKARGLSDSRKTFESAAAKYERALKLCESHARSTENAKTLAAIKEMGATARDGGISAYLNAANLYSSRGNYNKATDYCNKALALDPNDAGALSMRASVSTAGGGWNRRLGRRGR